MGASPRPLIAIAEALPPSALLRDTWKECYIYYEQFHSAFDYAFSDIPKIHDLTGELVDLGLHKLYYEAGADSRSLRARVGYSSATDRPVVKPFKCGSAVIDPGTPETAVQFLESLVLTNRSVPAGFRFVLIWPKNQSEKPVAADTIKAIFSRHGRTEDPIINRFLELIGDEIPFDPVARRALIDRLRPTLGPHLDYWERTYEWWKKHNPRSDPA